MNKIILTFLLVAILLPSFVLAKDVEIALSAADMVGYTEEMLSLDLTIRNNQDKDDRFSVNIWPPFWEGVNTILEKYIVSLSAKASETIKIYFDIPINAEEKISVFNITVKSLTNSSIAESQNVNIRVIRKSPLYVSDLKVDKHVFNPGESVNIVTSVANKGDEPARVNLQTTLKKLGQVIEKLEENLDVEQKGSKKIEQKITFDKYAEPGTYMLDAELRDSTNKLVSFKSESLKLNAVPNVTHQKIVSYGLLLQTVVIKVKNEGNIESTSFYVTEDIPGFMKSFFYPTGDWTEEKIYDRILYHWLVPSLMPGEERIMKYEINLWYGWVVSIIVVACVVVAFRYVFTPQIVKRHKLFGPITRESEIIISLDVRNRSRHEIKNVVVRDLVPPILKVVRKFETLKPMIKATPSGTEVVWKLASMKPREERILTYRVMPVVDMTGSLKLPKARISYTDRKKMEKSIVSKTVLIKPS